MKPQAWCGALVALGLATMLSAAAEPSADELAIRKNVQAYIQAFEKQDAKALAAMWTPDAVYVDGETGRRALGREAIEAQFRSQFKKAGPSKLRVHVQSIRFATPDVAIEDGTATVIDAAGESSDSTYTAVHVKHGEAWLIDSIRETAQPPAGNAGDHLKELGWLVGSWTDTDAEASIHSEYKWTANQAFLVNEFTVETADRLSLRGTQIIGWDAAVKQIRSWAFDSAGGFAEATWQRDGDRWLIHSKSTLPDGKRGAAINILRKIDDDHATWRSTARHIDGEMLPNVPEIGIVRDDAADIETNAGGEE